MFQYVVFVATKCGHSGWQSLHTPGTGTYEPLEKAQRKGLLFSRLACDLQITGFTGFDAWNGIFQCCTCTALPQSLALLGIFTLKCSFNWQM